jgi:hypothetical protein
MTDFIEYGILTIATTAAGFFGFWLMRGEDEYSNNGYVKQEDIKTDEELYYKEEELTGLDDDIISLLSCSVDLSMIYIIKLLFRLLKISCN